jgi:hypothetical protein
MYKRFAFEGDVHTSLECVPLTVRRKLDLSGIKISLAGWQQLARDERLSLCHLPVDCPEEIAIYREIFLAFCARRHVPWKPLQDPAVDARLWNAPKIPTELSARTQALGVQLDEETWAGLDEESRYALVKLVDPKRQPEKLAAALCELGLLAGPVPATACEASGPCTPPSPAARDEA